MTQSPETSASPSPRRHPVVAVVFRIVVCLGVIGAGLGVAAALTMTAPAPSTVDAGAIATRVVGLELREAPIARRWIGYGTVEAVDMAMIPSRVASTVLEVPDRIRAGAEVRAGDVIVRLDPSDFEHQYEAAVQQQAEVEASLARIRTEEAALGERREIAARELDLATSDLDRVRAARERGAALPREIDLAEQQVLAAQRGVVTLDEIADTLPSRRRATEARRDQLEAAASLARMQVERCVVSAPFDGVIAEVFVDDGEQVQPGLPVARVLDPNALELPLRIPATARGRVAVGDRVVVRRTVEGEPRDGEIVRISPEDAAGSRTMTVFVEVDDPAGELVPGLFVRGEVVESDARPRIVVPRRSVRNQRILAVRDGRVEHVEVRSLFGLSEARPGTGLFDRQWLVLEDGVPDGTVIVVDGTRSLEVGAAVEIVPPAIRPAAEPSTESQS